MKKFNIVIKQEAKDDIINAFLWYEEQKPKLGEKFIKIIDDYFYSIAKQPKLFPVISDNLHKASVKKFPFIIVFFIDNNDIVVVAVFNAKQNPNKLKSRIM